MAKGMNFPGSQVYTDISQNCFVQGEVFKGWDISVETMHN